MPPLAAPLIRPKDAAALLGVHPVTLSNWRARGFGPAHVRMGSKVLYTRDALARFIAENTHDAADASRGMPRAGRCAGRRPR